MSCGIGVGGIVCTDVWGIGKLAVGLGWGNCWVGVIWANVAWLVFLSLTWSHKNRIIAAPMRLAPQKTPPVTAITKVVELMLPRHFFSSAKSIRIRLCC